MPDLITSTALAVSPSERWVRAWLDGQVVVDTVRAVLVKEPGKAVAFYAVPAEDVAAGLLAVSDHRPDDEHPGAASYLDLVTPQPVGKAAWNYPDVDGLAGYVGLRWDAFDSWSEEDEPIIVHPRTPFHRVDAIRSSRHVVARHDGRVLADTGQPVAVFETGLPVRWYVPVADVRSAEFVDVALQTACPYKGVAGYRALAGEPDRIVQWRYDDPYPDVAAIEGHVAFFDELVDVEVDGVAASRPRTQWTHGLRNNLHGGGSGYHQHVNSAGGHPPDIRTSQEHQDHQDHQEATVTTIDAEQAISAARRHPVPDGTLTYEPSQRWVRATIRNFTVVDSRAPVLLWEPDRAVPHYVFPRDDVHGELTSAASQPTRRRSGAAQYYDLRVPGVDAPFDAIAFGYAVPELAGYLGIEWFGRSAPGIEHWYEEDEEIFVHPRDPYKRVDPIRSTRHVQVSIGGTPVADSRDAVLLFETRLPTRYYLPVEDVRLDLFEPTDLATRCPYKGEARYWSFVGKADQGGNVGKAERVENVVWSYPDPIPAARATRDLLAFYNESVDITVDGVLLERPHTEFTARLAP